MSKRSWQNGFLVPRIRDGDDSADVVSLKVVALDPQRSTLIGLDSTMSEGARRRLTEGELTELLLRSRNDETGDARERVIAQVFPWGVSQVAKIARKHDCDLDDAVSVFSERLLSGLDGFDPARGALFGLVYRIAQNSVRECYKKRARDRKVFVLESQSSADDEDRSSYHERHPSKERADKPIEYYQHQAFLVILAIIGGYPHQQIAFGLTRYLVSSHNAPQAVTDEYGPGLLPQLLEEVRDAIHESGHAAKDLAEFVADVIRHRMKCQGKDLFGKDYPHLATREVDDTQLCEYFGKTGGARSIADWNSRIRQRIERCCIDPDAVIQKSRLPEVLPHQDRLKAAVEDIRP